MSRSLGEITVIYYGKSPADVLHIDGLYPIIGTGGEYGRASRSLFSTGVVVPRKGSLGNPQLLEEPFWPTDTTYAVIPNSGIDVCWLYYNLLNFDLRKLNEATGVPSISRDWLTRLRFYDPGYEAQIIIATILQTIDRTITHTEALIEKYQQIKAGLMHDLFTRGIGADGQLRPVREEAPELYRESAIGWIPKEWGLGLLNEIVNPSRPVVYGILMPGYGYEDGVPVIKVKDIRDRKIDVENLLLTSPSIDHEYRRSRLKESDILLTIRGTVGRVCTIPAELENSNITQDSARIDILEGINEFYSFYFETEEAVRYLSVNTLGVAVQGINLGEVRKLPVPKPAKEEQKKIIESLSSFLRKLDTEKEALQKLKKQKSGLMHDLLTGKVQANIEEAEIAHG